MAVATGKTPARGQKKVTLTKPPANEVKKSRTPRRKTTVAKKTEPVESKSEETKPAPAKKAPAKKAPVKKSTAKTTAKKTARKPAAKKTAAKAPAKKTTAAKKTAAEDKIHRGYIIRYVHTMKDDDGNDVENLDYVTAHDKFHYDIAVEALKSSFGLDLDSDKVRVGRIDILRSECDIWNAIQNAPEEDDAPDGEKGDDK